MLNFGVGPSKLYPTVRGHIEQAMGSGVCELSHRSSRFQDVVAHTSRGVREVLDIPSHFSVYFLASATEAMERILQGCVERYSHHLVNGAFSERFFGMAIELGKEASFTEVSWGSGWSDGMDIDSKNMELLAVTQNETSTGVWTSHSVLESLRKRYPQALLVLDIVSSVPHLSLRDLDFDAAFFSVQKGFGLPAGLGVLVVNEACLEKARSLEAAGQYIGGFHSLLSLEEAARKNQTPETPNMLGIYLLGEVCQDFLNYGMDRLREETDLRARSLYQDVSGVEGASTLVKKEDWRSPTVLVFEANDAGRIRADLAQSGALIGAGYGPYKQEHFRLANFPAQTQEEVSELLHLLRGRVSGAFENH